MTWRELAGYVQGLPPQARVRTALREGREEPTGEQMLLADVYDMLGHVDWHVQTANATKDSKLPKPPKPYPRWWVAEASAKPTDEKRLARIENARQRARDRKRQLEQGAVA